MAGRQNIQKNRIYYFDYLRVFATFAVITLHTAAQNWNAADVHSFDWNVFNVYDSLSAWGVSIFLMLSGALFLSKDRINIKKLYSKNISRLVTAYFFWSLFYAVTVPLLSGNKLSFSGVVRSTISGHFHLWFIPMIIGLYMSLPIIRKITETKELTKYFLILSFVFSFVLPQVKNISVGLIGGAFADYINAADRIVFNMYMKMFMSYAFYFVFGYVLFKTDISEKQRKIIYALGIAGALATCLLDLAASLKSGTPASTYAKNFNVNVLACAAAVFVWCRYNIRKSSKIIEILSTCSFGVYLVHVFILEVFKRFGFNTLSFNPVFSVPAIVIAVASVSFGISIIISKIPVLKNRIV